MPVAEASRLRAMLARHPRIELAILFGSVAQGRARADSDLDLAVSAADGPLSEHARTSLIAELAETFGRPVDLVDLRVVGEPLLGQILAHGVRLLGGDDAHARLLSRHWLDEADFMPYRRRILAERRQAWIGT